MAVFPDPDSMLARWAAFAGVVTALGHPELAHVITGSRLRRRPAVAVLDDGHGQTVWWSVLRRDGRHLLWGADRRHDDRSRVFADPELAELATVVEALVGTRACSFAFVQTGDEWVTVGDTQPRWPPSLSFLSDDAAAVAETVGWVERVAAAAGHAEPDDLTEQVEIWTIDVGRGRATSDVLRRVLGPLSSPDRVAAGIATVVSFDRARAELTPGV
ncbi:MAG: hypothetical protein ACK5OX_10455 [Desertimonas sp.]